MPDLMVRGLAEVQESLARTTRLGVAAAFAKALDRAAGVFAAQLESNAALLSEASGTPLYEHVISAIEVDTKGRGGIAQIGFDSTPDDRTGKPQDLKAFWLEYGHMILTHKGEHPRAGKSQFVPANPIARRAFEAASDSALQVFIDTFTQTLSSFAS